MPTKKAALILLTSALLLPNLCTSRPQQINCKRNPIYCQIMKFRPKANPSWAFTLSNDLVKYGRQYHLDPWRSLAIAMQESSLAKTRRYSTVLVPTQECNVAHQCFIKLTTIKAVSDVGLFQLHASTVQHYGFDATKVSDNLDYMVKTHYQVLADKIKLCQKLGNVAWSCYHSKTTVLRKKYIQQVNRYYKKPLASTSPHSSPRKPQARRGLSGWFNFG